ncbi:MAG: HAD hydrolase family protein [Polyangiales bacterium]
MRTAPGAGPRRHPPAPRRRGRPARRRRHRGGAGRGRARDHRHRTHRHGALPTAARLNLDTTLVCAEGAVLVDPQTGAVLLHQPMHVTLTETVTEAFDRHALDAFWFLHDEIHGEHGGADLLRYVETWSPRVTLHDALSASFAWEDHRHRDHAAVASGTRDAVQLAHATVTAAHGEELLAITFPASRTEDRWTLLTRSARTDKATAFAQVAAGLGIAPHEVAVVGDRLSTTPMFAWAGRSFVMDSRRSAVRPRANDGLATPNVMAVNVATARSADYGLAATSRLPRALLDAPRRVGWERIVRAGRTKCRGWWGWHRVRTGSHARSSRQTCARGLPRAVAGRAVGRSVRGGHRGGEGHGFAWFSDCA